MSLRHIDGVLIMAKENKTQYAILGILSIKAMSGYDIKKIMDKSTQHFWAESNGQLYPTLSKLVQGNFIVKKSSDSDNNEITGYLVETNRNKIIYELTDLGREKLNNWIKREYDYYPVRSEFLLKVFFGKNVSSDISINHIKRYLSDCEDNLIVLKNIETKLFEGVKAKKHSVYYLVTVKSGIKNLIAEIQWCNESIELIEKYS